MILVCGGAGYIGSHTVAALVERGIECCVLDNLEKGHRQAIPKNVPLFKGDLRDEKFLAGIFGGNKIDAVIDFAAYSLVGESMSDPFRYYDNNVMGTLNLLKAMKTSGVGSIVFSSTAATYGIPERQPICESDPAVPINPYGDTKLAVEKILKWTDAAYGIKYAALRYFNASGAHVSGKIGEDHSPESHLIPNILKALLGDGKFQLFGNDYNTPDGTCVRDYVHVSDLADAHILALEKIMSSGESRIYNLGSGGGFSNLEIIKTAENVTGLKLEYSVSPRRVGDPDKLVASSEKISAELGWKPRFDSLEKIIETAWIWHKSHPGGFGGDK